MNKLPYVLRCIDGVSLGRSSCDFNLHVLTAKAVPVERFEMMCEALDNDISPFPDAGEEYLEGIRKIEAGESDYAQVGGNAWITHITYNRVWFEGIYSQGEGGEVTFSQYKLAVQTYSRFASDPERKRIEVIFPDM
jgi:hypothetical protein